MLEEQPQLTAKDKSFEEQDTAETPENTAERSAEEWELLIKYGDLLINRADEVEDGTRKEVRELLEEIRSGEITEKTRERLERFLSI